MRFESELATAFKSCNTFHTFEKYAELLSPELIQQGFKQAGVATIRKRRLPLETVLWSIIGMALYRQKSVWDILLLLQALSFKQDNVWVQKP